MKNLSKLDTVAGSQKGFELQLFNPGTLENLGIYITVLGRDSEEFRKVQAEHNRKRVQKMQKAGNMRINITTEELENETIELLVACTKAWRSEDEPGVKSTSEPVIMDGNDKLECTPENVARLYRGYPWIKEQVDAAVVDRANFLTRS